MTQTVKKQRQSRVTFRTFDGVWSRNEVTFMGNLGKDAEMSYTHSGKAKTTFSIAVHQGQGQPTMWLNVVCWEQLAEEANNLLKTGTRVEVRGRLTQRKWNEKYYHDVVAYSIEIIESDRRTHQDATQEESNSTQKPDGFDPEHPF